MLCALFTNWPIFFVVSKFVLFARKKDFSQKKDCEFIIKEWSRVCFGKL